MTPHAYSIPLIVTGHSGPVVLERVQLGNGRMDEDWLQRQIHAHPSCLPIDEIEPGFTDLVPVCMELSTPHGFIDNLFLTPNGEIVIGEVKLWRNPEMRRKVVAQALDYAACLFSMDYEALEQAVLKTRSAQSTGARSLYDLTSHPTQLSEAAFVDAINTNLKRGRALILVIGDGIRSETQQLMTLLEDYGNLEFTFALVELAVYTTPDRPDEHLICPRVLTKTELLRRTIFDIQDRSASSPPRKSMANDKKGVTQSISSEQFWEAMTKLAPTLPDRLRSFLTSVEELGVSPEFRRSLILRWTTPEGQPINLGYIEQNGKVWTNDVHNKLPSTISDPYIHQLAESLGSSITLSTSSGRPNIANNAGGGIVVTEIADKLHGWRDCIASLIEKVRNSPDEL